MSFPMEGQQFRIRRRSGWLAGACPLACLWRHERGRHLSLCRVRWRPRSVALVAQPVSFGFAFTGGAGSAGPGLFGPPPGGVLVVLVVDDVVLDDVVVD